MYRICFTIVQAIFEDFFKNGYKINPYNIYMANKMINGGKNKIVWYMDDNKFSHKEKKLKIKQSRI